MTGWELSTSMDKIKGSIQGMEWIESLVWNSENITKYCRHTKFQRV